MPVTYIRYIKPFFSQKRAFVCDIYLAFDCAILAFRTLVQFTSVYDLKETLLMTHISLVFFVLIGVVLSVCELADKNVNKHMKINMVLILITLVGTVVELALFAEYGACTIYGMSCFVIYIVANTIQIIKRSQVIEQRAKEAEIYHNLAYTDGLTGILNRLALMRDLADETMNKPSNAILMIDLNDLKKCNDGFGHEYGDIYIKTVATALSNNFDSVGHCYRIGGDEFCVLTKGVDSSELDNRLTLFREEIDKVNQKGFVVHVAAAVGCAFFDDTLDENLSETMKRADAIMYQNKQIMKQLIKK
jgi:diguanylate cyclase (GGDEF)-like protein